MYSFSFHSIPINLQSSFAGFLRSIPSDAAKTAAPQDTSKTHEATVEPQNKGKQISSALTDDIATSVKTVTKTPEATTEP